MSIRPILPLAATALLALPAVAAAQSAGSTGMANYQSGYGGSRYTTSQAQTGSTRDANGNRLIVDGLIQSGASAYSSQSGGVASAYAGAGQGSGGTAIGGGNDQAATRMDAPPTWREGVTTISTC